MFQLYTLFEDILSKEKFATTLAQRAMDDIAKLAKIEQQGEAEKQLGRVQTVSSTEVLTTIATFDPTNIDEKERMFSVLGKSELRNLVSYIEEDEELSYFFAQALKAAKSRYSGPEDANIDLKKIEGNE